MNRAVLFDLDGVLITTELQTFRYYQEELKKVGINLPDESFRYKAGRKSADFFQAVLSAEERKKLDTKELVQRKRDLFNNQIDLFVSKVPGGQKLLSMLQEKGYRLALASQNESRMINSALCWLGVEKYFEIILSLDDISQKKPDPEIYLLAAKKLGMRSNDCIVVEDSMDGIQSAKAAGMKCVGFYHDYMPESTFDDADVIVNELSEIDEKLLDKLFSVK